MSDARLPLSIEDRAAYEHYLRVRDEVARMKRAAPAARDAAPSLYWTGELENIDYMSDASPLIVRKLRHHAFQITGIRPYDYREYADRQVWFERRLQAIAALAGGTDLLVEESSALGGFGYRIDGRLYNVDTLKFFEVLVGMRRAGLLDAFTSSRDRRVLLEIGGGWGGFAYQFKTLFPNTTYVIVDLPEVFLFSATYLMTVFPDAKVRFWREGEGTLDNWADADFVFVPNDRAEAVRAVRPDLLVNLVSFQEMTSAQVESYVELAAAAGCPALYSLNRERSLYNQELESVGRALSRRYDLNEIRLLGSDYTKAIKRDSALTVEDAARANRPEEDRYRHLAGTLRAARRVPAAQTGAGRAPLVGIGVTLHNKAPYLPEALDSLLAQSYPHFRIVLVDDGSTDGTEAIARAYAERDPRVRYVRRAERGGMVAAWRSAFEEAVAGAEYFAWGSDHDRWHPDWLTMLVEALEESSDVVLAYPLTQRIDATGVSLSKPAREFETYGVRDLAVRWAMLSGSASVAAGDMVYGLMRPDAVRKAGVFRPVLCPDRLLIAELTLQGQIRQVPEVLWYRRQFAVGSVERQRTTLFAPGAPAPSALTPPWYLHARALWSAYVAGAPSVPGVARSRAAAMVVRYAASYAWRHYAKTTVQRGILSALGWPRWIYKRAKHGALVGVYHVLVALRQLGITPFVERVAKRERPWRGHA